MTAALAFLPVLSVVGFALLGLAPTIAVLMTFQVLRRAGNFAVARPAREVLFTVVPPSDRYKAKTFIDTVVYRAGDQLGAWAFAPLAAMGPGVPGISGVAVVLAVAVGGERDLARSQDAGAIGRRGPARRPRRSAGACRTVAGRTVSRARSQPPACHCRTVSSGWSSIRPSASGCRGW